LVSFSPTVANLPAGQQPQGSLLLSQAAARILDKRAHYWRAKRLWSGSYFAGSFGGAPITALHRYIEQQNPSVLTGA
jgi:putative transposase